MKSKEKLQAISEHLHYEYSMFTLLTLEMRKGYPPGTINNALLQSFALNVRNLIDFLYPRENSDTDDVIAQDFFETRDDWLRIRPSITPLLKKVKKRVNKEAAHLTYSRLKVIPIEKGWNFVDIANDLVKCFDIFITNVSRELLHPSWKPFWEFRSKHKRTFGE